MHDVITMITVGTETLICHTFSLSTGTNDTNFHKHVPNTPLITNSVQNVYATNNSNGTTSGNSNMELIQSHGEKNYEHSFASKGLGRT